MLQNQQGNPQTLPKIGKKILVAEDVLLNQVLVQQLLESWDCSVEVADNGLEALAKVKTTGYDLILMDIQMPIMDGLTATREIRDLRDPDKANLPILAFTSVDYGDLSKYKEAGMDDYIIKPYTEEGLHRKITRLLAGEGAEVEEQAKAGSNEPKLYSLAMIESIGKNNEAFTSKMIVMFVDVVSQDFAKLKDEAAKQNWVAVGQYAHKMKSTFGNMAVSSVLGYVRSLETQADEPINQINLLEAEIAKVNAQIKNDYPQLF